MRLARGARALFALCFALVACSPPPPPPPSFAVSFFTEADPGVPLAGVKVQVNDNEVGVSGPEGLVQTFVRGPIGTKVSIGHECPEGYRPATGGSSLQLRRLKKTSTPEARGLELRLNCLPLERVAAFVVQTENGNGFPVLVNGKKAGRMNKDGLAHVSARGEPGERIQLTIDTSSNPKVKPQNPVKQFTLPDEDTLLFVMQEFKLPRKKTYRRRIRRIRRVR